MSELPAVTGREAIRAFEKAGFTVVRIRGSHHILKRKGCRYALSIPVHGNKPLSKGLLRRQIKTAGLTEKVFLSLSRK
jgi:predicted RNA binding protein YcfA (HicA-like mRNA interferase family)